MPRNYARFLTNVIIGLLFGLATGLILELIAVSEGWAIVLALAGAIIGAVMYVVTPPRERT